MCGRYALYGPVSRKDREPLTFAGASMDFPPRYNLSPMQHVPVVWREGQATQLGLMRWGLLPAWAKDESMAARLNNARAETVAEKPAFRAAWRRRRCLIPMNGFYEWQPRGGRKQPYYFRRPDMALFAVAGIHEQWQPPGQAAPITTFAVMTTAANAVMSPVHDRMPVIIPVECYDEWLDPANDTAAGLERLLRPCADDLLQADAVSLRVNNAREDDAGLIDALPPSAILPPEPQQGSLL